MTARHDQSSPYEPPRLTVMGAVHELTQGCDKKFGSSDGYTFMGPTIVCNRSA
jgi:hypothetical protein